MKPLLLLLAGLAVIAAWAISEPVESAAPPAPAQEPPQEQPRPPDVPAADVNQAPPETVSPNL